jgi:hypothetical protein
MSGWIAISRDLFEHGFFAREPMSEREAWVWMIARAAWKDTRHRIGGEVVDVPRGSFFCTLRELQQAWGWGSDKRVRTFLKRLENGRMVDANVTAKKTQITICNYDEYQEAGRNRDASEDENGRNRDALKEQVNNKQETKEEDTNVSSVVSRSKPADDCLAHFNAVAARVGWPQVQKITPARRAALSQRISDVGGEDAWRQAIDRAARSPHLTGQNNRGWVADFDWLTKAANFTKLMEGNYDPRTSKQPNQPHPANGRSDRIDPALEQIARLTGFATAPGSGGGGVGSAGEETRSLWLGSRPQ